MYLVLVCLTRPDVGDENLPDAGCAEHTHLMQAPIPVVKVTDYADPTSVRSPDGERNAGHVTQLTNMRPELVVKPFVPPFSEQVLVETAKRGKEGVWVTPREGVDIPV